MRYQILTFLIFVTGIGICCRDASARKWTDKTGKFSVEADFVSIADGAVSLKRPDGQVIKIPLEKLSETDQEVARAVAQARATPHDAQNPFVPTKEQPESAPTKNDAATPADTRELSPPQATGRSTDSEPLREVVANGLGQNPEAALRNAQQAAIEQVVGVLIDAKTITDNDAIIKEKILTASNAYIERCDELKQWKQDGLDYCRVRAVVRVRALREVMEANKIAIHAVRGQDIAVQFDTTKKANMDASAMLTELISDFPNRVLTVEAKGDPKAVAEPRSGIARVRIPVKISVDREAYASQLKEMQSRMDHLAIKKFTATCKLPPQDPVSPSNEIEERKWYPVFLISSGQQGMDKIAYPLAGSFVPELWYACVGHSYGSKSYNRRTSIDSSHTATAALERARVALEAAHHNLSSGVLSVKQLRKDREQELVAVMLVGSPQRTGTAEVTTYAIADGIIPPILFKSQSPQRNWGATVTLSVKFLDVAGKTLESDEIKLQTKHEHSDNLWIAGFIKGSPFSFSKENLPSTLGIWPGLCLSSSPSSGSIVLVQSYRGNIYVDIPAESLAKVRKVSLSIRWEPFFTKSSYYF